MANSRTLQETMIGMSSMDSGDMSYEEMLQKQSKYNQQLLSMIPDMIFVLSQEGHYVEFKPAEGQATYVKPEHFLGKHFSEILPPHVSKVVSDAFELIRQGGTPEIFEYDMVMSGVRQYYECKMVAMDETRILAIVRDVSARARAEMSMRLSEAKYRSLFESTADAILLMDGESFYDCNNACLELFEIPTKVELSDIGFKGLIPDIQSGGISSIELGQAYGKRAVEEGVCRFEWTFWKPKTKELIQVDIQLSRVDLPDRTLLQSVIRDISQRQRMEEALKINEQNFRYFFETLGDMIFVVDQTGCVLYTNKRVEEKLGYDTKSLIGVSILDFHPLDLRKEASIIFGEMIEGKRSCCPLPLVSQDGIQIPVETRIWPGVWDGQRCIFGISKDLTIEQEALQKFNKVFENNPALMALTDEDGLFVDVNGVFLKKTGYLRHEVIGNSPHELRLFPESDKQKRAEEELLNTGRIENKLLRIRTKNGTFLDGLFSGDVIESQGKRFKLTVMVDISDYLKAQRMLKEAAAKAKELAKQAQAANAAKSIFLANMSHEIRTPMNGILGFIRLLEYTSLSPEQDEYIQDIKDSSDTLLTVINDILDMSKIEAGCMGIERIPFKLADTVERAVLAYGPKADEKGIRLLVKFNNNLPDEVIGDPMRLKQVIGNLVSNAIKFTDIGDVNVEVNQLEDGMVQISVKDTGIGIAESAMMRLFNPFVQGDDSSTRKFGGTGLGLAICKSIVELMGGALRVVSKEGEGAEFIFTIPISMTELNSERLSHNADIQQCTTAQNVQTLKHKGMRIFDMPIHILLVEDNATNQKVFARLLRKAEIDCDIAADGFDALRLLELKRYDIIFMDCQMPNMDGYETTQKIRTLSGGYSRVPIIAMTACAMEGDRERCIEAGMNDYLVKPVDLSKLEAVLEKYCTREYKEDYLEMILKRFKDKVDLDGQEALEILAECLPDAFRIMDLIDDSIKCRDIHSTKMGMHQLRGVIANLRIDEALKWMQQAECAYTDFNEGALTSSLFKVRDILQQVENRVINWIGSVDEQC